MRTAEGASIQWVDKLRYLGICILSGKTFRCCFDNAKKAFYRAFNAVFGKIGRCASEEVILDLVRSKCLPSLLYGTEACPLNKTELRSLNFTVTRVLMKLFNTYSAQIIEELQEHFNFSSCECLVKQRTLIFLRKYCALNNTMCASFTEDAQRYLAALNS